MFINIREMFLNDYLSKCAEGNKFEIHGSAGGLDGCLSVVRRWPDDCPLSQCASVMTTHTEHTWNHDKR